MTRSKVGVPKLLAFSPHPANILTSKSRQGGVPRGSSVSNQPLRGRLSALLIAAVALLAGAGIAAAAISAVVSSSAPDDRLAVETGPAELVGPERLINYGG